MCASPTLVMDLDMCGQGHDVCRTVEDWILHESYINVYVFHLVFVKDDGSSVAVGGD